MSIDRPAIVFSARPTAAELIQNAEALGGTFEEVYRYVRELEQELHAWWVPRLHQLEEANRTAPR